MVRKLLTLLLLVALPASATTYYVDSVSGSDSNNGTSTGTPWQTIAKINAQSFNPGDSILLKCGDVFYNGPLTVPTSGSNGNPITFGHYGTCGANPIVKGSLPLTTSGFTLASPVFIPIFSQGPVGSDVTGGATINERAQLLPNYLAISTGMVSLTITASASANMVVTGTGIGQMTTIPNASSITRITWGGNTGITIPAGTSATSDQVSYSLNNGFSQIVTMYTINRNYKNYEISPGLLYESAQGASDQSQSATVSGYGSGGETSFVTSLNGLLTPAYTYTATPGVAPVAMWENGVLLKKAQNEAFVEGAAGSFYTDGTNLFIHATDGSNVATNGKSYTYFLSSSVGHTTWDNGQSYLIFNGIDQAEVYSTDSSTQSNLGLIFLTGSHNLVENLASHDAWRHNFCFYIGAASNTATNLTLYNSYGDSPVCIYGSGTTGNLLQKSSIIDDPYSRSAYVFTGNVSPLIIFHGGSTNNTVDSNILQAVTGLCPNNCVSTATSHGYGILIGDSGTTATVSHNLIYGSSTGSFEWPIAVGAVGPFGLGTGATLTLWDNVIDASGIGATNDGAQAAISLNGGPNSLIYGNTVFGSAVVAPVVNQTVSSTGVLVKNNIFYFGSYVTVDTTSETSTVYDYNDYYSAAGGTPFSWGGTAYNFSNWQSTASQDAHSITTNPTLTNPAAIPSGGNYTLVAGSPAIAAGVSLGGTYQSTLLPSSVWPGYLRFASQPSSWTMGAFLFQSIFGSTLTPGSTLTSGSTLQ